MTETRTQAPPEAPDERPYRRDFGAFARAFAERFFAPIAFPTEGAKSLARLHAAGEVVHVMRTGGVLNFLYLAYVLLKLGLSPLRAAIGMPWSYWSPYRRLFRRGSAAERITRALDSKASALVFLHERTGWIPRLAPKDDPFFALVARARRSDRPLYLVPDLFLWHDRPRSLRPGIWDFVYGSSEAPSMLVTAWDFLLNYRNAYARVGTPIDLTAFVRENAADPDEVLVRKVRGALLQHLARETRALIGPPRKPPERIIEETLRDRTLKAALDQVAEETKAPPEQLRKEAERHLRRIAARYSPLAVAVAKPVLNWFFTRLHAGVEIDEKGLDRALNAAREAPLVFCPSHKSHLDYLLMGWVLADRGLMPPLVAAGANLSFFPLGAFLRRCGAFFLRRTFKGDRVYTATFKAYVKKLLREGYPQEFFIEGGRSRTGKLLAPKLGMVSFQVDAFLEGAQDDVFFVPVAIDYEKLVEGKSYARELAGGEKRPESLRSLLSTPKVLASRYGRVYLTFDEPVSLRDFLLRRAGDLLAVQGEVRRSAIRALSQRITFGIGRVSTITPAALLSAALLAHRRRGITAREASARIHYLREIAGRAGARLSPVLDGQPSDPSTLGPINEVLRMLMEDGVVKAQVVGPDTIYSVPDEKRPSLAFYKNNLVHLTVGRSMVAMAVLSAGGDAEDAAVRERVRALVRLLKLEFSFPVGRPFDALFDEDVDAMEREGLLLRRDGRLAVAPEPHARGDLAFLRDLVRDHVESYRILVSALPAATQEIDRKELLKGALVRGRADFLAGGITCAEALSKPTLENALGWAVDEGLLVESEDGRRVRLADPSGSAAAARLSEIDALLRTAELS